MRSLNRSDSKEDTTPNSDTTAKRDRVYGVPLAEILKRESPEREAGAGAKADGGEVAAEPVWEEAEGVIPKMVTSMLQFLETEEGTRPLLSQTTLEPPPPSICNTHTRAR
jgi:hypothetical protein